MRYIYLHPLFEERKCSHRFSYHLNQVFMDMGLRLERFDYRGTGEASRGFYEVTLDTLRKDVEKMIGSQRASLIGLRLGASLGFEYCRRKKHEIQKLIMIEPVIDGKQYVNFLLRKQRIKDMMSPSPETATTESDFINIEGYKTNTFLNKRHYL